MREGGRGGAVGCCSPVRGRREAKKNPELQVPNLRSQSLEESQSQGAGGLRILGPPTERDRRACAQQLGRDLTTTVLSCHGNVAVVSLREAAKTRRPLSFRCLSMSLSLSLSLAQHNVSGLSRPLARGHCHAVQRASGERPPLAAVIGAQRRRQVSVPPPAIHCTHGAGRVVVPRRCSCGRQAVQVFRGVGVCSPHPERRVRQLQSPGPSKLNHRALHRYCNYLWAALCIFETLASLAVVGPSSSWNPVITRQAAHVLCTVALAGWRSGGSPRCHACPRV